MTSPTSEERAAWRRSHTPIYNQPLAHELCKGCGQYTFRHEWRCPLIRTLDALDAQEERVRQLEAALTLMLDTAELGHDEGPYSECAVCRAVTGAHAALANTQPVAEARQ